MRTISKFISLILLFALLTGSFTVVPAATEGTWTNKVDTWVLETAAEGETEFVLFLSEQADLSGAASLKTKLEKGRYVFERLTAVAESSQKPLLGELEARRVPHQAYWVANMVWVRGDMALIQDMARRADVAFIYANPSVLMEKPVVEPFETRALSPETIEWNIQWVNADHAWAAGYTGVGAVIGGQDTGYDWDHPALINQYRGWDGITADHNYQWHDAIHSAGGTCGPNSPEPCDDSQHGTHTMGTMVGDDGCTNQIGMAPGARWIGCRNMDRGVGTPTTYTECYQWFIAPTDLNDQNPRPDLAPDVINNSWSCPVSEGCTDPNVLLTVVENVRAAGILTAHSAGNDGARGCESIDTPAAIYEASFTVGATGYLNDNIASFSSRGSVTVDGSNRLKPDISAPGVGIRSSLPGGGYSGNTWQGTSMAAPHVAGMVALLVSADPALRGQVDTLEALIESSAVPRTTAQECGGIPGSNIPNNTYGWGRIDVLAALEKMPHSLEIKKTASAASIALGETLTYTINITHQHSISPTYNVTLTDTIPLGTTFISATEPHSFDGSTVSWNFPILNPEEVRSVELVVEVPACTSGKITNDMYGVRSDEAGNQSGDPVETDIRGLALCKSASAAVVTRGDTLTYTLAVTNLHPLATMHNLILMDTLPDGTSFVSSDTPHTIEGEQVTWELASLAALDTWTVTLTVEVAPDASGSVDNLHYSVNSDEVLEPIAGEPLKVPLKYKIYLLFIGKE